MPPRRSVFSPCLREVSSWRDRHSFDVVLPVAERSPAMPRISVANARSQIPDVLARDNSSFAVRATHKHWAASLALDINQCAHGSVPESTLAKDTFAWKEWMRHCDKFNTIAWRPDRNGLESVGRARESFLFDSFIIEDYKRMVRNKHTAKPHSAVNNLLAVKRVSAAAASCLLKLRTRTLLSAVCSIAVCSCTVPRCLPPNAPSR